MSSIMLSVLLSGMLLSAPGEGLATVADALQQPPKEYTSGPLWVWNDMLTAEDVVHALDALAQQHVRQVWVHPRPGLMTPYLSDEWFALWQATLDAARARDMLVWIYDENSYPSGFAGGNVPEEMPESRGLGLTLRPDKRVRPHESILAVYERTPDGYKNVTEALNKGNGALEGDLLVARAEAMGASPWYGGKTFVDLLRPGVTEKFLEVTLDAYKAHFGKEFGGLIPGSFTDEPHLKPCGDIHWTPDLPEQYRLRWNEDFFEGLPNLRDDTEAGRRFRHHYLYTINELFAERWGKVYYTYCEKNGLEFTGHYWEHGWPNCASVPDNMIMGMWQHRPGIDTLFNQYSEGPHAQFGNVRSVIELGSVARQCGRARTLCEAYGGSGAEMRFEDYKRYGDWLEALGINTINEHLSDISIRGARKRDYPPTFSYHSPWMPEYHVLVDYFSRVSFALSQGRQINRCLFLEPTTTAWMHQFTGTPRLEQIGGTFQALVTRLAREQLEFDLGSEGIIEARGSVGSVDGRAALCVGECAYTAVIVPADMENLNRATFDLLEAFLAKGGTVFSCAGPDRPACIDGQPDAACERLRAAANWKPVTHEELTARVNEVCAPTARLALDAGKEGIVYHHRRQLDDGDILFIVNTSNERAASGKVVAQAAGVREADLDTGAMLAYASTPQDGGGIEARFELEPCGSVMLFLDKTAVPADAPPAQDAERSQVAVGGIEAKRLDDNHLILDYLDIKAGDETGNGLFWKKAAAISFQQNGLRGNIWDHCVQFRDELLHTEFPAESGFEAVYRFTIEEAVPAPLYAVVERADLYTITCNGVPLDEADGWWLDRAFGKLDLAKAAKVGENTLSIKAMPMTIYHELEAAHILGDFSLRPAEKGFVIAPSAPLGLGAWTQQGMPQYGHRVAYTTTFEAAPGGRYTLKMPEWNGVVAKVSVNGAEAGHIYCQPMECDITGQVRPGENTVEVVIYGSLRNTLGPHLGDSSTGFTHPGSWNKAPESGPPPGANYFSIGYGLLAPFEVWCGG